MPDGYSSVNPLGEVLHRYRSFFELFGSFKGYDDFWLLDDLVTDGEAGIRVNFLLPRESSTPYDFTQERALPANADEYAAFLIASDDFVDRRNRLMATNVARSGRDVCPACVTASGEHHIRGW